ncbi:MAG: hypothetical protein ACR2KZ_02085 [Segetibacter sp.]
MPLFDFYPIETTSTIIERKKVQWVLSTQTTSSSPKATFYSTFINGSGSIPHQSFTRVSISTDNDMRENFMNSDRNYLSPDYDLFVPLPIKKIFIVKGQLKSVSKLHITPSID